MVPELLENHVRLPELLDDTDCVPELLGKMESDPERLGSIARTPEPVQLLLVLYQASLGCLERRWRSMADVFLLKLSH